MKLLFVLSLVSAVCMAVPASHRNALRDFPVNTIPDVGLDKTGPLWYWIEWQYNQTRESIEGIAEIFKEITSGDNPHVGTVVGAYVDTALLEASGPMDELWNSIIDQTLTQPQTVNISEQLGITMATFEVNTAEVILELSHEAQGEFNFYSGLFKARMEEDFAVIWRMLD